MSKRIALVEDDDIVRNNYAELLKQRGFEVEGYKTRAAAEAGFRESPLPDMVILDIRLADEHEAGFQLCANLRQRSAVLPIIFLTASDTDIERISGMRLGADDYLGKDLVSMEYLAVRIETLFRRIDELKQGLQKDSHAERLVHGPLRIDIPKLEVHWKDKRVELSLTQFWLTYALVAQPGVSKSYKELMSAAKTHVAHNTITAHIRAIRNQFRHIDPAFDCIKNIHGYGYLWTC